MPLGGGQAIGRAGVVLEPEREDVLKGVDFIRQDLHSSGEGRSALTVRIAETTILLGVIVTEKVLISASFNGNT